MFASPYGPPEAPQICQENCGGPAGLAGHPERSGWPPYFTLARVRDRAEKGDVRAAVRAAEVDALRAEMAYLTDASDGA